ncbi:shaker cognate l-PA [Capsaspora owczarzaki ATCC 30864]|uniref:Shaker cognate l-PA n=1 Tax=Capsaspora owczarzaki (strain ATCC 30864) TaxID=595528 RepID=A0A0D2VZL3_CAPO3|nr:shaker cognate l-PA [Capsaspora owczarzaki ATCC 30864]KJE97297.1 shaker cognate l-PA [Capsaspora owczarzaki ATCC 30864]|eukprot:XP_004343602.1 shaker cognate l-PA [Capsaspora owczarzaki ATCC 30864]
MVNPAELVLMTQRRAAGGAATVAHHAMEGQSTPTTSMGSAALDGTNFGFGERSGSFSRLNRGDSTGDLSYQPSRAMEMYFDKAGDDDEDDDEDGDDDEENGDSDGDVENEDVEQYTTRTGAMHVNQLHGHTAGYKQQQQQHSGDGAGDGHADDAAASAAAAAAAAAGMGVGGAETAQWDSSQAAPPGAPLAARARTQSQLKPTGNGGGGKQGSEPGAKGANATANDAAEGSQPRLAWMSSATVLSDEAKAKRQKRKSKKGRPKKHRGRGRSLADLSLRSRIFLFLSDANYSLYAYYYQLLMFFLIILSTFTFCLGTVLSFNEYSEQKDTWFALETIIIVGFCFDYIGRLVTAPRTLLFVVQPMNIIDLLAILPYFVDIILTATVGESQVGAATIIRILRLFRVMRLFKMSSKLEQLRLVIIAISRSREGILLLLLLVVMSQVVFGSCMYYAETSVCTVDDVSKQWTCSFNGNQYETPYQNIPAAFWWCIVTITTVGYGDQFPVTPGGKIVASITMLCGLLVIAFPVTMIGSNLNEVYAEYRTAKAKRVRQQNLVRAGLKTLVDEAEALASGTTASYVSTTVSNLSSRSGLDQTVPPDFGAALRLCVRFSTITGKRVERLRQETSELETILSGFTHILNQTILANPEAFHELETASTSRLVSPHVDQEEDDTDSSLSPSGSAPAAVEDKPRPSATSVLSVVVESA